MTMRRRTKTCARIQPRYSGRHPQPNRENGLLRYSNPVLPGLWITSWLDDPHDRVWRSSYAKRNCEIVICKKKLCRLATLADSMATIPLGILSATASMLSEIASTLSEAKERYPTK